MLHEARKGVTLLEVLLVAALLFVIIPMGVVIYSNYYGYSAAGNAVNQLTFELRKAQMYSMMDRNGNGWGVTFVTSTANIVLYSGSTYATRNTLFDESYNVPGSVSIAGLNETDFARVTGYPNVTSTVSITASGRVRKVTVQAQGVVSHL